jgi:hypothetical protein
MAVRGRMTVPFKTLVAAKDKATIGDTIIVLPATYYETANLAKNAVNWHFLPGATVENDSSTSDGIFNTGAVGSSCAFQVTGHGVFILSEDTTENLIKLAYSSDNISIECDRITSEGGCVESNGSVRVVCRTTDSLALTAIKLTGSGTNVLHFGSIYSGGAGAIEITGGTNDIFATRITAALGRGIKMTGGTSLIDCYEIKSTYNNSTAYGVEYANPSNTLLQIKSARIVSSYSTAVYISSGTSGLKLANCTLVSAGQYSIVGVGTPAPTIQMVGYCVGNKMNSNVTLVPLNMFIDSSGVS